jgi:predicted nucleic acid-binding protein
MRIYLDSCALNRLFDDRAQPRVRLEAEAVETFFRMLELGLDEWVAGEVIEQEIGNHSDEVARNESRRLLAICTERAQLDEFGLRRGEALRKIGYGTFDALHLACAEFARVDVLLTTDDRFLRKVKRGLGKPTVRAMNPVDWKREFRR